MILIKDGRVVDPASGVDEGLDVVLDNRQWPWPPSFRPHFR